MIASTIVMKLEDASNAPRFLIIDLLNTIIMINFLIPFIRAKRTSLLHCVSCYNVSLKRLKTDIVLSYIQ